MEKVIKKRTKIQTLVLISIVPLVFFIFSLLTIKQYGISWDEPIHFQRGQAYLYYFLTGEKDYKNLPIIKSYVPKIEGLDVNTEFKGRNIVEDQEKPQRSYFQNESFTADYFIKSDSGHPPLNGILSALTNKILYQELGIFGDIESHHLFIILSATLLVFVVSAFAYQTYGLLASFVSSICVSFYPLFFAESHFNIKDPPEAAFIGLTIWAFWNSINKKSWKWLLLSIVGFSLALGTKFNVLFLPIILFPYLFVRYIKTALKKVKKPFKAFSEIPNLYLLTLIASPILVAVIFFGTWPFLWQDLWGNTESIFKYYKSIGTGGGYQPNYILPGGYNIYPIYWIIITTPVWMLALTFLGILSSIVNIKRNNYVSLLFLLWFFVPILRISMPNTTVYGGIRQIMEYVPAMALLSGVGASYISLHIRTNKLRLSIALVVITVIAMLYPVYKYHPNENVYFNSLIGGLSGAHKRSIPSNGNSFGNAYLQAMNWINENVEQGAELSMVQGTLTNIPAQYVRPDIKLWNGYWSAINREGEYLVELTYEGGITAYQYAWDYVENFLEPVYEVKVDNVAIAKVWKNDIEHTKKEFKLMEKKYTKKIKLEKNDTEILMNLEDEAIISRFSLDIDNSKKCSMTLADVFISKDGIKWLQKSERFLTHQINAKASFDGKTANYYFAGDKVKHIKIKTNDINSCLLNIEKFSVTILQ